MNKDLNELNLRYYADYFNCMFWADIESNQDIENGDELGIEDITKDCLLAQIDDLNNFFELADNILDNTDYSHQQACHDFYLTRNGHGVGFWENDHCNEEQGKQLTEIAKSFGETYISLGDDKKLYIS